MSHRLWQHRFGGRALVVGETLWLDGTATTIVGVMPAGLSHMTQNADFWVPARPVQLDGQNWIQVIARLAPGVTLAQAQVTTDTLAAQRALRETDDGWGVRMEPLHEAFTRDLRQPLFLLWGAVGFVLLIACANVAVVLLTRASARTKEVATRLALGASRGRVARMFLAEGVLLALAGGGLGSLLALGGVQLIRVFNPDSNPLTFEMFPRLSAASVDGRVFGYTLLISLVTALLFSGAPALTGSRLDLTKSLKDAGRGTTAGASRLRLRSALVVGQVALALVLLTGAGLMVGTLRNLTTLDPGFDVEQVLTFRVALNRDRSVRDAAHVGEPETELSPRVDTFHARVLRRLQTLPGVESAAGINFLPLSSSGVSRIVAIAGHPAPTPGDEFRDWRRKGWIRPLYRAVMGDYFDVMDIPLLRGRAFTVRDGVEAPWVVVINRAMAETYWPNEDPVGQPLRVVRDWFGGPAPGERQRTVVGVVEDVNERSLQEGPRPTIYVHAIQQPLSYAAQGRLHMSYVIRTAVDPMSLAPVIQRVVAEFDPDQPVYAIHPMQELRTTWTDAPRFYTFLAVIFAVVAVGLSVIGIYGVMAYAVTQRTHEIGIRMALGAARGHVVTLVAWRGLALGASGVVLGLVGAFWLTQLVQTIRFGNRSILYGVGPRDATTFAAAAGLLLGAVLLACYGPTRVATKVDPMTALRHE